jgi:RNA polymerase sigma-70 factor (ECF subfamily)
MGGLDVASAPQGAPEGSTYVTRALELEQKPAAQPVRAQAQTDAVSFRDVFGRYAPYVLGLVRRLGVREAEVDDVAQEVFIVVHRQLPHFEGRSSLKTWLCGITLRTVANHRRKVMRRREASIDISPEQRAAPEQHTLLERQDNANSLLQALDTLTPKLREVFVLYEIEELPMIDVARTLGCPRFTAYTRLHAARAALRQRLAEHDPGRKTKRGQP